MANLGLHPIDSGTPEGALRLSLGDTLFTEVDPEPTPPAVRPEPREVSYANFSDDALEQLMVDAGGSTLRAKAYAYAELAAIASHKSVTIKTNDLGYTKERTASELRELAEFWSREADKRDEIDLDSSFEIVHYPGRADGLPGIPNLV